MADRYQALRDAIATGPTPGPRSTKGPSRSRPESPEGGDFAVMDRDGEIIAEAFRRVGRDEDAVRPAAANAALMAAADPDTIRALLAERDALREALQIALGDVQRGPVPLTREEKIQIMRAALAAGSQP